MHLFVRAQAEPVFAVGLWADLGKMSKSDFGQVREAIERVTRLPVNELTGRHREPAFTLEYSYQSDGLLTFERVVWTGKQPS